MIGNRSIRKAVTTLRGIEKPLHQLIINIIAQQTQSNVITLGYQGRELQSWNIQQEYVHGRSKRFSNDLAAQVKFADKSLRQARSLKFLIFAFQSFHESAIDARGQHNQVIIVTVLIGALNMHKIVFTAHIRDEPVDDRCTLLLRQFQQVTVKAAGIKRLRFSRPVAAINGGNALLHQGRGDFHLTDIHMQRIRFDPSLNHAIRQHDALSGQALHQRF